MKKIFFIFFLALLINGCALKNAFKSDPIYEKTLKYTERSQIINSFETKALIDVVYLNPLYQEKFKNPTFLVGVYNNYNNKLINNEFNITLNGNAPLDINSTIPSYIPYKFFPFYNSWMNYYIVTFPSTHKPYVLKYISKHYGYTKFIFR